MSGGPSWLRRGAGLRACRTPSPAPPTPQPSGLPRHRHLAVPHLLSGAYGRTSHILSVLSMALLKRKWPSGDSRSPVTVSVWPAMLKALLPLRRSQTCTALSRPPLYTCRGQGRGGGLRSGADARRAAGQRLCLCRGAATAVGHAQSMRRPCAVGALPPQLCCRQGGGWSAGVSSTVQPGHQVRALHEAGRGQRERAGGPRGAHLVACFAECDCSDAQRRLHGLHRPFLPQIVNLQSAQVWGGGGDGALLPCKRRSPLALRPGQGQAERGSARCPRCLLAQLCGQTCQTHQRRGQRLPMPRPPSRCCHPIR